MSHTAEEKIKILYEDSLKEIRDLTTRIENIKGVQNAVEAALKNVIASMPAAADREMQRAGGEVMRALSGEVGRIAQRLAGDAAAAEKAHAISFAATWAAVGVLACAVVFGSVGFGIKMLADEANLSNATKQIKAANERVEEVEKQARDAVDTVKKSIGWMGSPQGQLAKRFFDIGGGDIAARCDAPAWEIMQRADGRYCVPRRRDLFSNDKNKYGWKIP